jgi:acyl-coenzyme A synthetase/AMP-(fatty) acid ligase
VAPPARFNFTRDVVEQTEPDRLALRFADRSGGVHDLSFGEVAEQAARWAGVLRRTGIEPGDRMLVLLGKTPAWLAVMLAALKVGAVAIPCSEMLRAKDLAFRARHSGATVLVADPAARAEIETMDEPPDVAYLDETELGEPDPATAETGAEDPALIIYTSGTTKDPKGVVQTHRYTWAKRHQAAQWVDCRPGDLVWCTAGTGWAKSLWNVLFGPWSCGSAVVLHEGAFDAAERFRMIEELRIDALCQAPTEYRLMAKLGGLETYDLSGVRHMVSAGEPLNPEVIRAFEGAFGTTIHDGYGQTENTLIVGNFPGAEIRAGSMGLPATGFDVREIDWDGIVAPAGEEGVIALRCDAPAQFAGYWNAPDETAAVYRGEWYVTGDRAMRDEDGYFWFTGRADDVILSAAYRIGPFEVESALLEHAAVAESAVVGKPDPDRGQIVKAFVVLRPGHEGGDALAAELKDHVKRVTAPYKYPREIEFVGELPKTRSGKIRRVELRKLEEERAAG